MKIDRIDEHEPQAEMLISVPKHCFKRAVKRNLVKRQVREAYRKIKPLLLKKMACKPGERVIMAFVWLDANIHNNDDVECKVESLIQRIAERI